MFLADGQHFEVLHLALTCTKRLCGQRRWVSLAGVKIRRYILAEDVRILPPSRVRTPRHRRQRPGYARVNSANERFMQAKRLGEVELEWVF